MPCCKTFGPFGLAKYCRDVSESGINRFLKHGHNEHSNRGGGSFRGDEVHGRQGVGAELVRYPQGA